MGFGGQAVVETAKRRLGVDQVYTNETDVKIDVISSDFDIRPAGYEKEESHTVVYPIPIPEVIVRLQEMLDIGGNDIENVKHEIEFCMGVLKFLVARLSSDHVVNAFGKKCALQSSSGAFLNLHCGHNNQFSLEERI